MDDRKDAGFEAIMDHLIEYGANDIATVFARASEMAMRIERERFLGTGTGTGIMSGRPRGRPHSIKHQ